MGLRARGLLARGGSNPFAQSGTCVEDHKIATTHLEIMADQELGCVGSLFTIHKSIYETMCLMGICEIALVGS